ncbi:conserved hypothetical protein [Lodderomyces elongisporus NRRL YB-4239]|uniref:HotDog ACOT-type domain-containing protein n=1 Tax=Lodderomyces elongisporus (strain ATCC 11503 / CBS 2605 / JCM 1781 / NBRC 1676 / NRRL YB-4239) TaxID=379508 RepID=A5E4A3_LODEL|nr:conserved hypothetical protein [Lodderomyces elongisporus NRRL YB-4239]
MLRSIRCSIAKQATHQSSLIPVYTHIRFNSQAPVPINDDAASTSTPAPRFHRIDKAGSQEPADAADAAATILADLRDLQTNPNKATWIDALKEREKLEAQGKKIGSFTYVNPITTDVIEKTREDSFSYLLLPFKKDKWLCDAYINAFGRLRAGQLFQDLDALAGRIAYRHCSPAEPVNVTASVDRIYMVKKVDEIMNYNFVLAGSVTWTGKSSMEITVKGYAFETDIEESSLTNEGALPDENVFLTANFTFVARHPVTGKSFPINRLLPITEQDWIDYRKAESHNAKKKLMAKNHRMIEPTPEESKLIYDMWRSTKALIADDKVEHITKSTGVSFMKDTSQESTLFMQPQYRNRHSYMIFGGYLLRQSFELAYCTAATFSGAGPRFVSLDSTTFKSPVPVGSVLTMNATISYTEHLHDDTAKAELKEQDGNGHSPFNFKLPPMNKISSNPDAFLNEAGTLIQVKVDTWTQQLEGGPTGKPSKEGGKTAAGTFIYSFFVPKDSYSESEVGYCSVIPQTYSEMMTYVGGRRRAGDTAQYVETLPPSIR